MDQKLEQLQERYEALLNSQVQRKEEADAIIKKEAPSEDEQKRFDSIVDQIKADEKELKRLSDQIDKLRELELVEIRAKAARAKEPKKTPEEKANEKFSFERAFIAAKDGKWDRAGLEREVMQERARTGALGWNENRLLIDPNVPYDAFATRADAYSVLGTAADGGNLVGTEYRSDKFVNALWNMTILDKLPVVRNTGLTQQQSIAVSTSKATATMVTEVASLGDSEKLTFGLKTATPKEMITKGSFSRMLDLTSAPQIRSVFQNQIMKAIAYKLDQQFIQGTGSSGQMYGILGLTTGGGSDQTTTVAMGTNGGALTYAKLVQMRTELAKDNIGGSRIWLTNAQVTGTLMTTLKDTANTASGYIYMPGDDRLLGFPVVESQTVPYNLDKGTSTGVCSAIILGNFEETEIFQWGNIAVEFDNTSGADNSLIKVRSFSFWDMIHKRPENYVIIKDATTTA